MRIAIISDIHSNPKALENVLEDGRSQDCQRFICLGDVVGYGYDPVACIDLCREAGVECVLGNHDAGLSGKLGLDWFSFTAREGLVRQMPLLDDERRMWLASLPCQRKESFGAWRTCFSHGTLEYPEEFSYIDDSNSAMVEMGFMGSAEVDVLFIGHTHYAEAYGMDFDCTMHWLDTSNAPDLSINLNNYKRLIVNVGSVGYPRNQNSTFYAIFDTEEQMLHYRSIPFDFDGYVKEMEKAGIGLPSWLSNKKLS